LKDDFARKFRTQLFFWIASFIIFLFFLWIFSDILLPFVAGMALAYFLDPVADWLQRLGTSRLVATIIIMICFVVIFVLFLMILIPILGSQISGFLARLPHLVTQLQGLIASSESTWLRGNTFYGKRQMFRPDFMEWFEGLRLPPYHLERKGDQYELTFEGKWHEVMMWEIPALAVLMELRGRTVLDGMRRFELQVLYARAMTRVWEKIETLRGVDQVSIADFGTRRRHSFLWQDWCVQAMIEGLGENFTGTSNCLIAMRREVEAIGTNAHELPMVYSALAKDDAALARAPYDVLSDWHDEDRKSVV